MTITTQPAVLTYQCNGAVQHFPVDWRFLDEADLRVQRVAGDGTVSELVLDGDYSVTGAGHDAGGTVSTTTAYADGEIRIWLRMPITQVNTYRQNDPFPARSHEDALDRLTLLDAMREEEFSRSVHALLGERGGGPLPPVAQRAGRLWASASDGSMAFVPTIAGDDILSIDAARVYFDHNGSAYPRLVIDPSGAGSVAIDGVGNPGGLTNACFMLQDDVAITDTGMSRLWVSMVFRGWTENPGDAPTAKHSRFAANINARSEISAPLIDSTPDYYIPQEVGALTLTATAGAGTDRAKVEALVVSAREEAGMAGPSKGVAVQAITVRDTQGPDVDDRSQIAGDDSDDDDDAVGSRVGSFTIRCNGGTVGGAFGGYRSWAALLASGRAGYLNGVVLGKTHGFATGGPTDPEGIVGWGGVWGGRSFWHDRTFAVYAKDNCPGWITIGHDGIPDSGESLARAPVDIESDGTEAIYFNGVRVLAQQQAGYQKLAGSSTTDAHALDTASVTTAQLAQVVRGLQEALIAHGLIAT